MAKKKRPQPSDQDRLLAETYDFLHGIQFSRQCRCPTCLGRGAHAPGCKTAEMLEKTKPYASRVAKADDGSQNAA